MANAVVPAGVTPFMESLPTLEVINATTPASGTTASASLEMVNANHTFHQALKPTPTFTYRTVNVNGTAVTGAQTYLGPVIVAKRDVPLTLTVTNNLGAHPLANAIDTTLMGVLENESGVPLDAIAPRAAVHLHGGNTDENNDGDPMDFFTPGIAKTYTYGNTQESAGLWYHDHAVGITRLNVFAGLAGGYLIRDLNDPGDSTSLLPTGPYEVPLIIQDRMFLPTTGTGTAATTPFDYPLNPNVLLPGGQKWAPEFFGDVATVNGAIQPNLNVEPGKYRFRVYNGSNARFYNFRFVSGKKNSVLTFFQIGTDGGLLDAPVPLNKLLLAPGERADLVVDFTGLAPGATVILTNDAVTPFPNGPRKAKKGGMPLPQIMQFTVLAGPGWLNPLPVNLRANTWPVTRLAGLVPAVTRNMTLVEIIDPVLGPRMALMNNRNFMPKDTTMTVGKDTLEQWDLINTTGDAHPMHLHFTQFQVLNRQPFNVKGYLAASGYPVPLVENTGPNPPPTVTPFLKGPAVAPPANEQGWKDTVTAMPGEVTRILVPFGAKLTGVTTGPMAIGVTHTGKYVSHCHILEHEDNDMMMRFVIQ